MKPEDINEIARLKKLVSQRGARMQIMKQYLSKDWWAFCRATGADEWFDDNGVPNR